MKRRYLYTMGGQPLAEPIEVSDDFTGAERRAPTTTEGLVHGNAVAQDGTDISSRKKRREYMRREGVADHGDFTETLTKAKAQREAFYRGDWDSKARREDIGRTIHQLQQARRRR